MLILHNVSYSYVKFALPTFAYYKVGPLPVINGVITPISRVITLFITSRGPPCNNLKFSEMYTLCRITSVNIARQYY